MKKYILILSSLIAVSCSESSTKEEVVEKVSDKVETTISKAKEELQEPISDIKEEFKEESKELTDKVETVITEVAETKSEAIKEAVDTKVKEVVKDIVPSTIPDEKKVEKDTEVKKEVVKKVFSHTTFDGLLKKYVSASGTVNYAGFKADRAALDKYIATLKAQGVESSWSRNEKLAYYINAYNAYTIQLILNNYPTSSIMKINNGKAWDLQVVNLGGKIMSLNHLENKIIRPVFKEPRIHFAVNCAAVSCPKLMNGAFMPNQLNNQLERQTKAFINNTKENQITSDALKLSQIFEWYATDFGDIHNYINKYSATKASANAEVSYNTYKWELNGK